MSYQLLFFHPIFAKEMIVNPLYNSDYFFKNREVKKTLLTGK